jgi:hypothetical protein
VVRLDGNAVDVGKAILAEYAHPLVTQVANTMDEAAATAAQLAAAAMEGNRHVDLAGPPRKVIVQGMTGTEGRKHTQRMLMSGTRIVGGVTPGKGGQSVTFERTRSRCSGPWRGRHATGPTSR